MKTIVCHTSYAVSNAVTVRYPFVIFTLLFVLLEIIMSTTPANAQPASTTSTATGAAPTETAIFASGCFWGTEYMFQKEDGVLDTQVGYTGGSIPNPTYQQVCTGATGHAEALQVTYDPTKTNYEKLARLFFETHDPTQVNGQGPDIGEQYRSAIFYKSEEQKGVAEKLIGILKDKGLKIATQVVPAKIFYPAENYHQSYYQKNGKLPYCHSYRKLF